MRPICAPSELRADELRAEELRADELRAACLHEEGDGAGFEREVALICHQWRGGSAANCVETPREPGSKTPPRPPKGATTCKVASALPLTPHSPRSAA